MIEHQLIFPSLPQQEGVECNKEYKNSPEQAGAFVTELKLASKIHEGSMNPAFIVQVTRTGYSEEY